MNKKNKIIRINQSEDILKGLKKIDQEEISKAFKKRLEEDKKQYQKDLAKYEKDIKAEEKRITNLGCPVCKSTNKEKVTLREPRTEPLVLGGRNAPIKTLAQYHVCQGCGVMYVDLNKKTLKKPLNPEERHRFL